MIKKLRFKFVLVFLVLVVSVFITSSCYAVLTEDNFISFDSLNSGITMDDVYSYIESQNGDHYLDDYDLSKFYVVYNSESNVLTFRFFKFDGLEYIITNYSSSGLYKGSAYDSSDTKFASSMQLKVTYAINTSTFSKETGSVDTNAVVYLGSSYVDSGVTSFVDITSIDFYYETKDTLIHSGDSYSAQYVDVTHEFQADTSAKVTFDYTTYGTDYVLKYSLSGVEVNTDLTAPVTLKNPVVYSPGVTNLVVSPNTKVYWVLYDSFGASVESDVYQVPEYDSVIENSDKKIEYEIVYSEDYTSATLNASLLNAVFGDKIVYSEFNAINSTTGNLDYGYQSFSGSLNLNKNGSIYLYALDGFGNILDVKYIEITEIFNFKDSDFSYTLDNQSSLANGYKLIVTPKVKNWSSKVDIKFSVTITSGNFYPIVIVDTGFPEYSYIDSSSPSLVDNNIIYTGKIMSGDSIIISSLDHKILDFIGNIEFKIYKKADNSLIFNKSYDFNIKHFTSGSIVNGSAGDFDGSLPGNASNSNDFTYNDYGDVDWNDVENYIGTSGSFWTIVKSILNQLPKWITAPIFFFISAVVAIALIKAILPG